MESPQEDEEGQFFLALGTSLYRGNGGIPSPTGQKLIPPPLGKNSSLSHLEKSPQ